MRHTLYDGIELTSPASQLFLDEKLGFKDTSSYEWHEKVGIRITEKAGRSPTPAATRRAVPLDRGEYTTRIRRLALIVILNSLV